MLLANRTLKIFRRKLGPFDLRISGVLCRLHLDIELCAVISDQEACLT